MPLLNFTFQESSPLISYSPGWAGIYDHGDPDKADYDGIFRPSSVSQTTATFSFLGTGATIFGAKRDNHGNYSVVLDNQPPFIGSGFAPAPFLFKTPLWQASDLIYGEHNVTLTNIPLDSGHNFVDIDFISIERQIGGAGDSMFSLTLDDTSSSVNYTGQWQTIPQATAHNNSLHRTAEAAAQVVITFPGCCIEVYGQYANANFTVVLDDQPPVTLRGFDVDLSDIDQQPQTLLYLADSLNETEIHTVELSNIDSNDFRPLYFDYALVRSTHEISAVVPAPQGSGTPSPTPIHNASQPDKGVTPVGAIAGGVVGGVAAVGLLLLAFFFVRRRRQRASLTATEEAPSPWLYNPNRSEQAQTTFSTIVPSSAQPQTTARTGGPSTYGTETTSRPSSSAPSSVVHTLGDARLSGPVSIIRGERREKSSRRRVEEGAPVQERDAGTIVEQDEVEPRLPPAYDSHWQAPS